MTHFKLNFNIKFGFAKLSFSFLRAATTRDTHCVIDKIVYFIRYGKIIKKY